ncbi:MAG: hypothetical protein HC892_01530 [Saprospiraceae bacterium]|nr:hypothetical protein [Saprospiraceae bacterium]
MKLERKHINIGLGALIVGAIGYYFYSQYRAKKIKEELLGALSQSKGKTGTAKDYKIGYNVVKGKDVRWTSPTWFGTSARKGKKTVGTKENAMAKAKAIYDALGLITNNEKLLKAIQSIKYQNEASYIRYYLNVISKVNILLREP